MKTLKPFKNTFFLIIYSSVLLSGMCSNLSNDENKKSNNANEQIKLNLRCFWQNMIDLCNEIKNNPNNIEQIQKLVQKDQKIVEDLQLCKNSMSLKTLQNTFPKIVKEIHKELKLTNDDLNKIDSTMRYWVASSKFFN